MQTFEKWGIPVLGNPLLWIIFLIQLKNVPSLPRAYWNPYAFWMNLNRRWNGGLAIAILGAFCPCASSYQKLWDAAFWLLLLLHVHYVGCMLNIAKNLSPKELEVVTKNSSVVLCFLMHIDPKRILIPYPGCFSLRIVFEKITRASYTTFVLKFKQLSECKRVFSFKERLEYFFRQEIGSLT